MLGGEMASGDRVVSSAIYFAKKELPLQSLMALPRLDHCQMKASSSLP